MVDWGFIGSFLAYAGAIDFGILVLVYGYGKKIIERRHNA